MKALTGIGAFSIVLWSIILFTAFSISYGTPPGNTAIHYIERGGEETGSQNLVTAIIMDYRLYDTLGEVTVLFTAILGVTLILGRNHHRIERKIKQLDHLYGGSSDGDVNNR